MPIRRRMYRNERLLTKKPPETNQRLSFKVTEGPPTRQDKCSLNL